MSANKVLINNIEVGSFSDLIAANYGNSYPVGNINQYLPQKAGDLTIVSLHLLASLFGLILEWDENTDSFIIKRGDKEIKFEKNKYIFNGQDLAWTGVLSEENNDLIPLNIFSQVFNIKGEWLDNDTINILDPLTEPFYQAFNEIHSIDKINQVYLFDLDSDGKDEIYVTYFDNKALNLASLNSDGRWLYDSSLKGLYTFEMEIMKIGSKKALAIVNPTGVYATSIYLFLLNGDRLINIAVLDSLGNGKIIGDEIHFIYRFYDTADHGIKVIYGWDEISGSFIEKRHNIFYWFDNNRVDFKNAKSVIYGFCEAIALGLEEEALSYCSPDIRFAFGKEGLMYSVKHPTINIRRLIDHFKRNSCHEKILQVKEQSSSEDKKLFIAYYSDIGSQSSKNYQVYRLVLQKVEEKWGILDINFLYNQMPTEIKFSPDVNLKAVYPIFSLFTCFSLDSQYFTNILLEIRNSNNELIHNCFIDRCSTVELVELFPGVQLSFFREELRLCYFTIESAEEIVLDKEDNSICISVKLVGEWVSL